MGLARGGHQNSPPCIKKSVICQSRGQLLLRSWPERAGRGGECWPRFCLLQSGPRQEAGEIGGSGDLAVASSLHRTWGSGAGSRARRPASRLAHGPHWSSRERRWLRLWELLGPGRLAAAGPALAGLGAQGWAGAELRPRGSGDMWQSSPRVELAPGAIVPCCPGLEAQGPACGTLVRVWGWLWLGKFATQQGAVSSSSWLVCVRSACFFPPGLQRRNSSRQCVPSGIHSWNRGVLTSAGLPKWRYFFASQRSNYGCFLGFGGPPLGVFVTESKIRSLLTLIRG